MAEDDILTFDELRTVQSEERSADTLQQLDDDFFGRARDYLDLKRDPESHLENREYRNARRVIEDIVDQRQKKIMKLAFLSVKSDLHVENLLPREEELFEQVRDIIRDHRGAMQDRVFDVDGTVTRDDVAAPDPAGPADEQPAEPDEEDAEDADDATDDEPAESVDHPDTDEDEASTIFSGDDTGGDADRADAAGQTVEDAEDTGDKEEGNEEESGGVHIRIEESVPAFMGTDLEPYGPYDPGDETRIPEKNASILVEKGKAERVE